MRLFRKKRRQDVRKSPARLQEYNRLVMERLARPEPVNIGCIATWDYVFDFLIFYESVASAWESYPFVVHLFTIEDRTAAEVRGYRLPNVEVHVLEKLRDAPDWRRRAALKVLLVEHAPVERCLVSDVDNVFLAETPEVYLLLDRYDFVFVGGPVTHTIIQTNLFAYRRSTASIAFARDWHAESTDRHHADASGLPFALLKHRDNDALAVKALLRPGFDAAEGADGRRPSPYDVQANIRPFELSRDPLGYRERSMGRAKVFHLGGIRCKGNDSVESRMRVLRDEFAESAPLFEYYLTLANRAAVRMGRDPVEDVPGFLRALLA